MPSNVLMPELSPGMEKGSLVRWLKKEGESFHAGDVLAEVETDKAIMEIAADHAGTLTRIVVPEGTADVPVNELIAVIAAEGESPASAAQPEQTESRGENPAPEAARTDERLFASPLARRIAKDAGIELKKLKGSGPGGRIVEKDVRAALARMLPPAAKPPQDEDIAALYARGSYETMPHDEMRRTVAARLTFAAQTIPQFHLNVDCEVDELLRFRERLVADWAARGAPAAKLSLNDLLLKAYALAFTLVPDANVTWTPSALLRHKGVDVGLAVALPGNGLITPVVRNAHTKPLSVIAEETADLVRRAIERKLKPPEFRGGTTALSNLGMYGIRDFTAIVNPPHATILAVGVARPAAIARNGAIVPATLLTATLTCDHRAVDGALGAELLRSFKRLVERPQASLA